ncbi:MAG: aminotransferase class IV [Candidatus Hadarchaeales archaeon]
MRTLFFRGGRPCGEPSRSELYGEGVFETFRWHRGPPVLLDEHVERMRRGAEFLGIPFPGKGAVVREVSSAVESSGIEDARVKVCLLSRGKGRFSSAPDGSELLTAVGRYMKPKTEMKCCIVEFRRNSSSPLLQHKTLNYLENVVARREAERRGADEALFLNDRNEVAEGAATNVFWFRDGKLFTPSRECGILPGITRKLLISIARGLGIEVIDGRFFAESVLSADEVFLTNSLIGMARVVEINGNAIGGRTEAFSELREALLRELGWSRDPSV